MRMMLLAIVGVLAACSPPAVETPEVEAANNCPARAASIWDGAPDVVFGIDASVEGVTCTDANATITIRDANGAVAYTETVPVAMTQALAGAESVDDMGRRLAEWITPAGASMDSVGDLAAWAPGAAEPVDAEVPFHPEARVTREVYEALRAGDAPMYCYEQSREAGVCLTVWDGVLERIGVQTYAG